MKRLIAAVLAALAIATPAGAQDRVGRITDSLRQSPVFVDPDVSYLLGASDRAALTRQIQAAGVPVHLAVVPLLSEDESGGDADRLASLLHRRLGRNGIYLIADQYGILDSVAYQVPRDTTLGYQRASDDTSLARKLHDVIDRFAHAPKAAPSDPPDPPAPKPDKKTTTPGLAGEFAKTFFPSLLLSGLVLAVLWLVAWVFTRVTTEAREALRGRARLGPRRLRRMSRAELVRLARAIGRAGEDEPGYGRALADYDAAKLLHDEKQDPGSRFAVVVLALDGQDALRTRTADPEPRCVANPLHGRAEHRLRRRLPHLPKAPRPLCDACEHRIRLLELKIDGARRPYYLAPGLWEKIRGRTTDLPERVLEYLGVE